MNYSNMEKWLLLCCNTTLYLRRHQGAAVQELGEHLQDQALLFLLCLLNTGNMAVIKFSQLLQCGRCCHANLAAPLR